MAVLGAETARLVATLAIIKPHIPHTSAIIIYARVLFILLAFDFNILRQGIP